MQITLRNLFEVGAVNFVNIVDIPLLSRDVHTVAYS